MKLTWTWPLLALALSVGSAQAQIADPEELQPDEGRVPYLFFHTPDCAEAPELAARFVDKLKEAKPSVQGATPELLASEQSSLF